MATAVVEEFRFLFLFFISHRRTLGMLKYCHMHFLPERFYLLLSGGGVKGLLQLDDI